MAQPHCVTGARAAIVAAAVESPTAQEAVVSAEVQGLGFYTKDDGYMYCDSLKVTFMVPCR